MVPENGRKVPRRPAAVGRNQKKDKKAARLSPGSLAGSRPKTTQRAVRVEVGGAKVDRLERRRGWLGARGERRSTPQSHGAGKARPLNQNGYGGGGGLTESTSKT